LKDWVVNKNITNDEILSKDLENEVIKYSKVLYKLNNFLNEALV
jgi:hypothetical protein